MNNYDLLIKKLDEFIRKYYLNRLIRGLIYSVTLILAGFLIISIAEYFLYLPSIARKVLFFGFLAGSLAILISMVIIPLLQFFQLGKVISRETAAEIIGTHFSDVSDKLLNILQLQQQSSNQPNKELILASINQKIDKIKPVPFTMAINLGNNKKYLKYLALPMLVFLILLFGAPSVITDSSTRLIKNSVEFERPAPFQFVVTNENMEVLQNEDFELEVKMEGEVLPDAVSIRMGGISYQLDKKSANRFTYKFRNLQKNVDFQLEAQGFSSASYELSVLPRPMIIHFDAELEYPKYTGRRNETLQNTGDLVVPQGTNINWVFSAKNTDEVSLGFLDSLYVSQRSGENEFRFSNNFLESTPYTIRVSNEYAANADSVKYTLTVIPDLRPTIQVGQIEDSVKKDYMYFMGEAGDDYGIAQLYFKYRIDSAGADAGESDLVSVKVPFNYGSNLTSFNHFWDLKSLPVSPGDKLIYYFEVWDNDAVNGSKSTRSTVLTYKLPTKEELEEQNESGSEKLKEDLDKTISDAEELQKEIQELQDKMLQKKSLSWEDKQAVSDILEKQKELEESVQELQKSMNENLEQKSEYSELSETVKKKQEQLQELFDSVLDEETKKLFEELEKMLEEMSKEDLMENLEDMELSDEQLEQELDRMLSLFKQLEFEMKMEETISKLDELAEEQEKLSEETESGDKSSEDLAKKQEELNKKFDDIKEDLDDLQEINQDMQQQQDFSEQEQMEQEIGEQQQNAQQQLQQNKQNKSSQSQKNASDKMKEMSESLSAMMQSMQMQQMQLDMQAIRQLLENLVKLSFDQEALMQDIKYANINDPAFLQMVQHQFKLQDDSKIVEDSLLALSKRVLEIESFITKELTTIKKNLGKSIAHLEERKIGQANGNQQYVMTSLNNLALMLSEVLQQMQQQMASKMPGSQMCQKPGNKSGKLPSLVEMQKQLNQQMSEMKEGLKKGEKPGGGMSKEMSEFAQKQAQIREALRQISEQENKDGTNSLGDLEKLMEEMDQTETDLVNKQLTEEMLERQEEILTRLLDAENAERERDTEEQRQSETAGDIEREIPPSLEEYLKKRESEVELYKTLPPGLRSYYKILVERYFNSITF